MKFRADEISSVIQREIQQFQAEVTRLMRVVLEVLDRRRPPSHLESWVPIGDFRALAREEHPGPRRLRSVRPSAPVPGVLEVCATFDVEGRARAMVGRFATLRF